MRKVAILLRKKKEINRFREIILSTLAVDAIDSAILCSGFFQEDHRFSLGKELQITGLRKCNNLDITTVGLYSYTWKSKYSDFINNLISNNCSRCLNVNKKHIPGMRWHAKIFIAKSGSAPRVAIIGSSNMTRTAFGINTDFNFESDVVIWDDSNKEINRTIEGVFDSSEQFFDDVIVTDYAEGYFTNRGKSLRERVSELEREILEIAVNVDV